MKRCILSLSLLFLGLLTAKAVPARPGVLQHRQPDGRIVSYVIRGDEHGHVMMTLDGCAVSLDEESGALCYAWYDDSGRKHDSGVAVGSPDSEEARAASRRIPPLRSIRKAPRSVMPARTARKPAGEEETEEPSVSRAIVILAQFQDLSFRYTQADFQALLSQKGYAVEGASGSALDYFNDQFQGAREFVFDVGPIVTLSREYAWYGQDDEDGNDLRAADAAAEACRLSNAEVDFTQYDFVYIFYAGGNPADGGASDDHIWPHAWDFPSAGIYLRLDGKVLTDYAMSSELMTTAKGMTLTGIGTFCHEFSHILGLPDLYDVDGEKSGGLSDALWVSLSLMDGGNYNDDGRTPPNYSALELEMLGLLEPEKLVAGLYSLEPMTNTRRALRMDTDMEGEYFLFECRASSGWDRFIGGSGMLVYHIDRSGRDAGYSEEFERNLTAAQRWSPEYNEVNCRPDHPCADLVEALPRASSVSQVFFPYSTRTAFSPTSDPPFVFWSGDSSPYSLVGIKKSSGVVSFTVNGPISLDTEDVFQDAAIFNWHTDVESCKRLPCLVRWTGPGDQTEEVMVAPYEPGKYSLTLEDLTPGVPYDLTICYVIEGEEEYPFRLHFTTSPYGGLPYIHMGSSARRNTNVSMVNKIPLRVMNAQGATAVAWSLNGRSISVGRDGYYEIRSGGELKAKVSYSDGTEDIIIRQVSVK